MLKVQVKSQIELDVEEILAGIAQLDNEELEIFSNRVMALRARRHAPSLSKEETALFVKINNGVSPEVRQRYASLNDKLHDETITPDEHQELLNLINQIELADAERIHALIDLAQLRNISVDKLMTQLGITKPSYG
ncbi:MAG: hypothetical protein KDE47_07755 [Caldilineaceae bacterium]|nr:hypothetical protein [Caldilineaceae bacterium]MCB0080806.1 hypothetical protein [Caldilineaceae bacterium]